MSRAAIKTQDLSAWETLFQRLAPDLPGNAAARRQSLGQFMAAGFPTKRQEAWKYMDLSKLADTAFDVPPGQDSPALSGLKDAEAVVFVNGRCVEGAARVRDIADATAPGSDSIAALNTALAAQGLDLQLGPNEKLDRPLHLISYRSAGQTAPQNPSTSHLRHRIRLQDNAEATVIVEGLGDGAYLGTEMLEIELAPGAHLHLYRVQDTASMASELDRTLVHVGRDAHLEAFNIDLGQGLARHDFNVSLTAPGANVELQAISATSSQAQVDNHVRLEHAAPHGRSRIDYRGIAGDRSRIVFDGLIVVAEGAVKTDSDQRLATLLLSSRAEINAKPELEIYNDDVRCNHGAATGQLDPAALFYLRSRGVDEDHARQLLTMAFVCTLLDAIALESLREHLRTRLTARVQEMLTHAETPAGEHKA